MSAATARTSVLLRVTGVVQGVGFRPFVHRLASRLGLGGWVRNEAGDVAIAIEGDRLDIDRFVRALRAEAPPLARIDAIRVLPGVAVSASAFVIARSMEPLDGERLRQPVSPDVAICQECEAELYDPADRRHCYPFITCTNCGPRHSVIDSMPYDRERTTMRVFEQCPECRREYTSISDRRYHSETNSCPACGPRLALLDARGNVLIDTGDTIAETAARLRDGAIVAVRGMGGFHLACVASNERYVRRLREKKHREGKPLAVMVRTLAVARTLAAISEAEAAWLTSAEKPIVVLDRLPGAKIAPGVSGDLATVGVMLAYTPLHMLLLDAVGEPLVMTSGNRSHDPLATSLDDALRTMGGIADAILTHDREIVARIDDSVLRVAAGQPVLMRRARGFAPLPVPMPIPTPRPLVAVGPYLKNTFAVADGSAVYPSQHIGDLETLETLDHWRSTLDRFRELFRIEPTVAVRDLHPGYLSTNAAEALGLERTIAVQHHHAHIAAVAAEHGVVTPVLGIAFDGTGYGDDDRVWGAELLVSDLRGYRRVGQMRYAPLPGGELAVRAPWRTALGYLSLQPDVAPAFGRAFDGVRPAVRDLAYRQATSRLNAPEASSMGRLFDAAAAVLGVCRESHFEGEAAMRLESLAAGRAGPRLPFAARRRDSIWVLDPLPLLVALGERLAAGVDVGDLAAAFHDSVVRGTADVAKRIADAEGLDTVALGGGVFQNARLLVTLTRALEKRGLRVIAARLLPPNDGGISYGQAAVAAAQLAAELG